MADSPTVTLTAWTGLWPPDDPDANFKREIALYAHADPLRTVTNLADAIDVPVGAIVRYVLARWASEGSAGLLELGPSVVRRLDDVCRNAEEDGGGTDAARLAAYDTLRQMISWLRYGLEHPEVYDPDLG